MEESDKIVWMLIAIIFFVCIIIIGVRYLNGSTETACNSTLSYEQEQLDKNFKVCKDVELEASKGIWPGIEQRECFNPSTPSP